MKILVTGGTGYIGSHTVVALQKQGYETVILDNLCNSSMDVLDRIACITGVKPAFYMGDVRNEKLLDEIFTNEEKKDGGRIEGIIHFAGLKAVGESVEKPIDYYDNNVCSTLNLCRAMEKYAVRNIVFSSSATVYGEQKPPFTEDMVTGGVTSPYGRTKLFCEEILKDFAFACREGLSPNVILLRYFNPVGAHESGLIGEAPQGRPNNLMPYIQQVASGIRPKLSVFGDDYDTVDGTGVRDYIHVVDLAEGHVAAIAKVMPLVPLEPLEDIEPLEQTQRQENVAAAENTEGECCEGGVHVYNLGTGRGTSVLELIHAFEASTGVKIPYEIAERRAGDIAVSYALTEKAKRELCWKAVRTVEDMCKDAWNFEKNRVR